MVRENINFICQNEKNKETWKLYSEEGNIMPEHVTYLPDQMKRINACSFLFMLFVRKESLWEVIAEREALNLLLIS